MRSAVRWLARAAVAVLARIPWGDALQWAAIIGGWSLLTWGVASLLVWQVWPISGGVFLLSVAGWGHLQVLFTRGLYALSKGPAATDSIPLRKRA